jgi:hypothetical protein
MFDTDFAAWAHPTTIPFAMPRSSKEQVALLKACLVFLNYDFDGETR